ncbi:restriction endonuclease subunit S [Maridesulfovibrio sp.]|uniref:restriction endonuclease subunit S n=1 Tax=Maridesulfovibrio sp. TaxID=2795000 RepID=UPI002A18B50E|nr:restriction endonuclease subunit S [Maridesulfovibrio sp.]
MSSSGKTQQLGSVCELISGQHIAAKDYNTSREGIGYLTGPSDFGHLNPMISKWTEHPKKTALEGDILITVKGSGVGKTNVLNHKEVAISRQLVAVRVISANPSYVYAYLLSCFDHLQDLATGAAIPGLSRNQILSLPIVLPPLQEQKRIVAIFDKAFAAIDKAIANTEKNLANARELFESYLNGVFAEPGDDWEEKKLDELIKITHGHAFKSKDFEVSDDNSKPIVLTPGNYSEDAKLKFNSKNTKRLISSIPEGYLFTKGDLTVVMTDLSSKMKILGKPAIIDTNNILHNQRIGKIIFSEDRLKKRFLFYFLQSRIFSDSIKATATGTMVRHTAPKRILANKICFPKDKQEQQKIIVELEELKANAQQLVSIYQQKLTNLQDLKQSILQKAFAGELTASAAAEMVDQQMEN